MLNKRSIKSLIIAELDGDISLEEKKALHNWISGSENNSKYYATIKDLWESSLSDVSDIAQTSKEWDRFKSRIIAHSNYTKGSFLKSNWYRIAAILIIGLLITNLFLKTSTQPEPVYLTSVAPKGSVAQTILPDGTLIYLNAGSELKYDININRKQRDVFIEGEAWFDVKRNDKKPFVVHTPYYNVEVLGTQFNVSTYKDEENVITTLEEGSIRILSSDKLKINEDIILKPGEQLVFNKTDRKLIHKEDIDTRLFTSWKDNKLIFLDMMFGDLVRLLERKYGVDIVVADKSILNEHYTGTIRNETILEILNIIEHTHPIQYRLDDQKVIITKSK